MSQGPSTVDKGSSPRQGPASPVLRCCSLSCEAGVIALRAQVVVRMQWHKTFKAFEQPTALNVLSVFVIIVHD